MGTAWRHRHRPLPQLCWWLQRQLGALFLLTLVRKLKERVAQWKPFGKLCFSAHSENLQTASGALLFSRTSRQDAHLPCMHSSALQVDACLQCILTISFFMIRKCCMLDIFVWHQRRGLRREKWPVSPFLLTTFPGAAFLQWGLRGRLNGQTLIKPFTYV